MEKEIVKCVEDLMNTTNVVGVLCADTHGLCLTAQGTAKPNYSGSLSALTQLAATIEPGKGDPVIVFDGQENQCMLHQNAGTTLAVYKVK